MTIRTRNALQEPHPHLGPLISSYQDGLTTPAESDQVERHFLECDRCRAFYAGLQQVRDAIADLPDRPLPPAQIAAGYTAVWQRTLGRDRKKR